MRKKEFQVTLTDAKNLNSAEVIQSIPGAGAGPVRIKAQPNANYLITDKATGRAPQQIHARRKNKDLLIQLDEYRSDGSPDLIVENFFEVAAGNFSGVAEDAVTYPFVPNTAQEIHQFASLRDGEQIAHVLGTFPMATATASASPLVAAAGFAGLGGVAAAGAGALGLAALAGGGGGGGKSSPAATGTTPGGTPQPPAFVSPIPPSIAAIDKNGDKVLNKAESAQGLSYVLDFAEVPSRPVQESDLEITGGKIKPASIAVDPKDPTRYTFVVIPDENAQGSLKVGLKPGIFKDSTGNSNEAVNFDPINFDTQSLKASWTTNIAELQSSVDGKPKIDASKPDSVLNIAEARAGLEVTLKLNEAPYIPEVLSKPATLTTDHLTLSPQGSAIRKDSFKWDPMTLTASFIVDPPANTSGKLEVGFSAIGKALTDQAGNPFTATTWSFDYDLLAPSLTVNGTDGGKLPLQITSDSTGLLVNYTNAANDLNGAKSWISLFGKKLDDLQGVAPEISENALKALIPHEGFYTLSFHLEDSHGNQSTVHQVLEVDPGNNSVIDQWSASNSTQQGTIDPDYFLDRAGSQTYDAGTNGSDQFVWLKAYANTNAKADVDIIQKFDVSGLGGVVGDVINLRDLLAGNPVNPIDLSKFLQAGQVKNADATDTYLYVNPLGQLDTSSTTTHEKLMNTSTQVIVLEGIDKNLQALMDNNNLYWKPLL